MERAARRQVAIVAGLAVAVAVFLALFAMRHGFFDLKVYYGAVNYWINDHGMLYDFLKPNSKYGFTYPPFAAIAMVPMAVVPWTLAILISLGLSFAATYALLRWLVLPIAHRYGWTPWFVLAVAFLLIAAFEPYRETITFGQVNLLLIFLVALDLLVGLAGGRRWAGVGIGLATAIKLTPGVFILYLLVTRRWRAFFVASGTAAVATLAAAAVDPGASRVFWTDALFDTNRVGSLAFVSNQSLQGMVARLSPEHPSSLAWLVLVVATLAVWARRVRSASLVEGLALTGVLGCLISPVTWVHHLVWLLPALILLVDAGLRASGPRRRWLLGAAAVAYAVLCSRLVWAWEHGFGGVDGFLFSNAYVWISLALLLFLPLRSVEAPGVAELRQEHRVAA
ncbi:glycosyltransferase 87 family protein [Asanoa sp. WMMD1127]|uniref:glycosyltransferase 87 family protein n=1 Tax=Asanoa sp. WMMD1127 TaxID=3016107 RepID=UPI002416359A|nr:glycosyltransferase 87 family protein [Asanoa sp. WMMD1127]MDG4823668.1 glycosyltransferase 87 family protein [Asanoa sp. WMMD1127]